MYYWALRAAILVALGLIAFPEPVTTAIGIAMLAGAGLASRRRYRRVVKRFEPMIIEFLKCNRRFVYATPETAVHSTGELTATGARRINRVSVTPGSPVTGHGIAVHGGVTAPGAGRSVLLPGYAQPGKPAARSRQPASSLSLSRSTDIEQVPFEMRCKTRSSCLVCQLQAAAGGSVSTARLAGMGSFSMTAAQGRFRSSTPGVPLEGAGTDS